jgi:ketosteroid isomerase-like protein
MNTPAASAPASSPPSADRSPAGVIDRIVAATNAHDLDRLVDCFAPDYRNETPVHPSRGFVGRDQVHRNWAQLFDAISDLHCEVTAMAVNGDQVWSEWEMRGTRPDGSPHLMRGINLFRVSDGLVQAVRFYLEPVDTGVSTVDDAVADLVRRG